MLIVIACPEGAPRRCGTNSSSPSRSWIHHQSNRRLGRHCGSPTALSMLKDTSVRCDSPLPPYKHFYTIPTTAFPASHQARSPTSNSLADTLTRQHRPRSRASIQIPRTAPAERRTLHPSHFRGFHKGRSERHHVLRAAPAALGEGNHVGGVH